MTGAEIMGVVVFGITVFGVIFGMWRYIDGKIEKAKSEASIVASAASALASLTREELAAYKLHASETFATKQGMHEQTAQLLRAIEGVGNRIDGVHERLDRAFEHTAAMPPRRRAV